MYKILAVHCESGLGMSNRFDTDLMPNAGIAVLCQIAAENNIPATAYDQAFLGRNKATLVEILSEEIRRCLRKKVTPIVLASVLNYNAEASLQLLQTLKTRFRTHIRTGVGGQHIRTCPEAYLKKLVSQPGGYLDHVGVGDAEVILNRFLNGEQFAEGYLNIGGGRHYTSPRYDDYYALNERLNAMQAYTFGPFKKGRQLVIESVRACSWAYAQKKACTMCALESVSRKPHFKPLREHFTQIAQLREKFGINWVFDVSNQWLPMLAPEHIKTWLHEYIETREAFGNPDVNLYVYLTSNSITPQVAPLLRKAGVRIAYVGIDGWEENSQKALNKPRIRTSLPVAGVNHQRSISDLFKLCRDNDLFIRTSLVVGSGLNRANVLALPEFVSNLANENGDVVLSLGIFEQIILPGSPVFKTFRDKAVEKKWADVTKLYELFDSQGYLGWEHQQELNRLFITNDQMDRHQEGLLAPHDKVEYEVVANAIVQAQQNVINSGRIIVTDIEDGGSEQLKKRHLHAVA